MINVAFESPSWQISGKTIEFSFPLNADVFMEKRNIHTIETNKR